MEQKKPVKGYKIFNEDFTCKGHKFSENSEHKLDGLPVICSSGFHFCTKVVDCFSYYPFNPKSIVCEVEAIGDVVTHTEDSKVATNHLKIGKRLTWEEVLIVANQGANNTGHSNTGDRNTGDSNTGGWNTGDRNTGYSNTGGWNTGDRNTGYSNTGGWNTGYSNTGDRNTGDRNTGGWNTGDRNTGYSNTGDRNTGVFCTGEKYIRLFDKESKWTEKDFLNSTAYLLLQSVDTKFWIPDHKMTEEEKANAKGWKTTEGYHKDIPFQQAFQDQWNNWSNENKKAFTSLPNFDKKIFKTITGVTI